jgi:hypothetical protein
MLTAVWEAAGGIRLSLIPSGNPAGAVSVVTSADGEFQFPDVVPGNYQMQFEGSPEFNRNVTLEEGRRRVLVPLGGSEMYSLFSGEDLPERVPAFAAVYQGAELKMLYSIEIRRSSVSVSAMDPTESTEFGLPSLLTDAEWKQVRSQATALIDVLLDVTRGPERFAPFLSSRVVCRIYYSGERRIPSIDDRRCAMYFLDSLALSLWLQAERTGGFRGLPGLDWYDEPTGAPDEVRVALTLRRHEVLREEFRRAGMFEPEHLARMQQYFRAVLIVPPAKFSITRPSRELPLPSGDMYMLPLPMFLIREGQQLRVVGAFQGGG